jgi:glutathione S-transferase
MTPTLTLIGQYDSPFVRRVAVALRCYQLEYHHEPWSVWRDAAQVGRFNPLLRVPTLVWDGDALIESAAILDALDDLVGPDRALLPRTGAARRRGLRICALATGFADKGVSLFYEALLHKDQSDTWVTRCRTQIAAALDVLEADRAASPTEYWLGDRLSHADIAVTCAVRFTREAHGSVAELDRWHDRWPLIAALATRIEERDELRAVAQPLHVSMPAT